MASSSPRRARALASAGLALVLASGLGCADDTGVEPLELRDDPTLPTTLSPGWNEIRPGGDSICARGGEYSFFVRPGTTNRVIIDFVGGGACWNQVTCSVAGSLFTDSVDEVRSFMGLYVPGLYDHETPDNPFRDWYHVVIPYCTGDIHWGDNVKTYGSGASAVTIHHKGAVNTQAVLDWVYGQFSAPEQILVTGCSAGAYGAALWSAHVMDHYPNSRVLEVGDSGAGIITDTFFEQSFPSWNAEQAFPTWIPALDPTKVNVDKLRFPDVYAGIGNAYPEQRLSQYNTAFDENQTFYFEAMGGSGAAEWSTKMYASVSEIQKRTPNFASFIAPGQQHCILLYENFYTVNDDGARMVDWLRAMKDGGPVQRVACTDCTGSTP
jgi:hypothetical protein